MSCEYISLFIKICLMYTTSSAVLKSVGSAVYFEKSAVIVTCNVTC